MPGILANMPVMSGRGSSSSLPLSKEIVAKQMLLVGGGEHCYRRRQPNFAMTWYVVAEVLITGSGVDDKC